MLPDCPVEAPIFVGNGQSPFDVFLCYSAEDVWAFRIWLILQYLGYNVFLHRAPVGLRFEKDIEEVLSETRVVVLIGGDFDKRKWPQRERLMLERCEVYVFLPDSCKNGDLRKTLQSRAPQRDNSDGSLLMPCVCEIDGRLDCKLTLPSGQCDFPRLSRATSRATEVSIWHDDALSCPESMHSALREMKSHEYEISPILNLFQQQSLTATEIPLQKASVDSEAELWKGLASAVRSDWREPHSIVFFDDPQRDPKFIQDPAEIDDPQRDPKFIQDPAEIAAKPLQEGHVYGSNLNKIQIAVTLNAPHFPQSFGLEPSTATTNRSSLTGIFRRGLSDANPILFPYAALGTESRRQLYLIYRKTDGPATSSFDQLGQLLGIA